MEDSTRRAKEVEEQAKIIIPNMLKEAKERIEEAVSEGHTSATINIGDWAGSRNVCWGLTDALEKDGFKVSYKQNNYCDGDGYSDYDWYVEIRWI